MATASSTHASVLLARSSSVSSSTSGSSSSSSDAPNNSHDSLLVDEPERTTRLHKVDRRPKATLHLKTRAQMNTLERIVARGTMAKEYHSLKPQSLDRGAIGRRSVVKEHFWILSHALPPILLQQLSYTLYPTIKWSPWAAWPVYFTAFTLFAIAAIRHFEYHALLGGTLREKDIGRDRTPDAAIPQLARAFLAFLIARITGEFFLKFDSSELPLSNFSYLTPVKMFTFLVVLDYFFYCYHRACHEIPGLWWIHSQHHATKTPSPVLSILAESYQEVLEIALIPLSAALIVPMSFHELFLAMCYTTYVEILGHTGMRERWSLPITGPILQPLGCDLSTERHDMHHSGGMAGKNYGKQTLLWDKIFGTDVDLVETYGM